MDLVILEFVLATNYGKDKDAIFLIALMIVIKMVFVHSLM
jgi:hypothetical protein